MKLIRETLRLTPRLLTPLLERFFYRHSFMTSQAGQDLWIFGEAFNQMEGGYFLDIGAFDGIVFSNTYLLECRYKWSGICVEANPDIFKRLIKNRHVTCLNLCLDRCEGDVTFVDKSASGGIVAHDVDNKATNIGTHKISNLKTRSLNTVLEEQKAPSIIDYMSIDVEGAEERILADFNFNGYTFKCITIERPTQLLRELLKNYGYIFIKEIPRLDSLYVHQDFYNEYQINFAEFYKKKYLTLRWM
jgi:FkbM family methyltransferase